ncbi:MAG: hypothetical protein K6G58_09695 [Lachnospiraceae bacterium]|nr:hypothetical protein [Lachnospiraceae bacterium]
MLFLPYETVELADLAKVEFSGINGEGVATASVDDDAVDALLSSVKEEHDSSWFSNDEVEDGDYAKFRQSLTYSVPNGMGLFNGAEVTVVGACDRQIAKKLKIDIKGSSGTFTVNGLRDAVKLSMDEVFAGLKVSFSGISPNLEISLENTSPNPLVGRMKFEILNPQEYYAEGDTVRIQAVYTEDMCIETGYAVDLPAEECVKEYSASGDSAYLSSASELPSDILEKAIQAGKSAFTDANEYGVRIFCEANLVPVYINKKATFTYGTPKYISSYFKTVHPEKAGDLGLSFNDLDIIYEVKISQADGVSCNAYGAVRFSDICKSTDGSYSYDFSEPVILSESYFSERVKKNVVESYKDSYDIERVRP